jgi:hypothetical protein
MHHYHGLWQNIVVGKLEGSVAGGRQELRVSNPRTTNKLLQNTDESQRRMGLIIDTDLTYEHMSDGNIAFYCYGTYQPEM